MDIDIARKEIEALLPDGSAFMLVVIPFGEEAEPEFITNADPEEAFEAMKELVKAKTSRDRAGLN